MGGWGKKVGLAAVVTKRANLQQTFLFPNIYLLTFTFLYCDKSAVMA